MEETIKHYLKQSLLSLIRGNHSRQRNAHSRSHAISPVGITRIQAGLPQAAPMAARVNPAYRRRRSLPGYTQASYLSRPLREQRRGQPMFRIS